jgi:uncharacterized protein
MRDAPEPPSGRRISASTLYLLHECDRLLWLTQHRRDLALPASEFDRLLMEKGVQHERHVRESRFPESVGPVYVFGQPAERAARETSRLLREGGATLYQPLLLSRDGRCLGVPDFLYREGGGLVVHDAKLAVNLKEHAEIHLQMAHYARLLEENLGARPGRLEITNGNGEVVAVEPAGDAAYEQAVQHARALLDGGPEPATLQTHSVCEDCAFYEHCWPLAVEQDRIEVLGDVTRPVASLLHGLGLETIARLAAREPGEFRMKGIAGLADGIIAEARAHRDGAAVWLAAPHLPAYPVVWFDLEGDPEGRELDKAIYLWGLAPDDGRSAPVTEAITADFEDQGGRRAWERFVTRAAGILERHPEARWVHYHNYEKVWLRRYVELYGAPTGFRERMEEALFDLYYRGVRAALRLPLYSYSIKKVADFVGFRWRNPESGSAWSIVQYQRARESRAPAERDRIIREIEEYNADDLLAMRAVWRWMRAEGPKRHCG